MAVLVALVLILTLFLVVFVLNLLQCAHRRPRWISLRTLVGWLLSNGSHAACDWLLLELLFVVFFLAGFSSARHHIVAVSVRFELLVGKSSLLFEDRLLRDAVIFTP